MSWAWLENDQKTAILKYANLEKKHFNFVGIMNAA